MPVLKPKSPPGPVDLLVIQGSPFCNISCTYCYLPGRHLTQKISIAIISKIFERLTESNLLGNEVTVVWHAGEPMAVPPAYYNKIFEVINAAVPGTLTLSHSFQTNATLLTQEWCDFIKHHNIRIGVSLDGPAFIHNKFRVKRNGKGSFDEAMNGIDLLKRNKIPFHVIAVVTDFSLDYPEEIFNFFLETGVERLGFNIEETEGIHKDSTITNSNGERVKSFLARIFDLQQKAQGKMIIREFESAFHKIIGNPVSEKNSVFDTIPNSHMLHPFAILNIDCDGNFMTFSPELLGQKSEAYGNFVLGNVMTDKFSDVIHSPRYKKIYGDIKEGVDMCRQTCAYYKICGGGAPSNKYYENGSFRSAETLYCKYTIQTPVEIVLADIEKVF